MGEIPFEVDGKAVDWHDTVNYRGMMFTGVPNLVWVFGYFRASWTLRVDMLGDFVCNLLNHMDNIDAKRVDVALREEDEGMERAMELQKLRTARRDSWSATTNDKQHSLRNRQFSDTNRSMLLRLRARSNARVQLLFL